MMNWGSSDAVFRNRVDDFMSPRRMHRHCLRHESPSNYLLRDRARIFARNYDRPRSRLSWVPKLVTTLTAGATLLGIGPDAVAQGWSYQSWYVHCSDPTDCAPADAIYKGSLEAASAWLDGLGFAPPELAPIEGWPGDLHAEVSNAQTLNREGEPLGIYDGASRRMYLSGEHFFAMGEPGQAHEDSSYQLEESLPLVPVHELFHAIQRGSQPGNFPLWIKEGSANAVLKAYAERFEPNLQVAPAFDRTYAVPLHKPGTAAAYATWRFWLEVGRQIGSPDGIAYLNDVLKEDLGDNEGLDGVDRALPEGLATQLPRFYAKLPLAAFEPENHRMQPSKLPDLARIPMQIREVAGKGAELRVELPPGDDATIHFALEPDHPDLHLIVDGTIHAQNVAAYEMVAGSDRIFKVVVANVARTPSKSEPRTPELKVTLLGGGCSVLAEVSGDARGLFPGHIAYYNAFEGGQGVVKGMAAGTGVDPGMHDQLQGLVGMMGGFVNMAERMGYEIDDDVKQKLRGGNGEESQAVQEVKAWEQELLQSGSDTFGLTLQAHPGGALSALLGGGFNMGLSGEHFMPQGPGLAGTIDFKPTMVYASAGLVDGNAEAVKFGWSPEGPGYVNVTMTKSDDAPVVYGVVNAELHAEGIYNGRRPKIDVHATFKAQEGFQSCMQ